MLIAPHGYDDKHTDILTEVAAEEIGAYAVINRGWERADKVDEINSLANCNNIDHLYEDVVSDEFLAPIERYYQEIMAKYGWMFYFSIHGCGNDVRNGHDPSLSVIVGYGDGNKPSLTCNLDMLLAFEAILKKDKLWTAAYAKAGSKFSGWDKKNLNQFWRKHQNDPDVMGFQLELVTALRKTEGDAEMSGTYLASVLNDLSTKVWKATPNGASLPVYP